MQAFFSLTGKIESLKKTECFKTGFSSEPSKWESLRAFPSTVRLSIRGQEAKGKRSVYEQVGSTNPPQASRSSNNL